MRTLTESVGGAADFYPPSVGTNGVERQGEHLLDATTPNAARDNR
jgi:hypothetical protein